VWLGSLMKLVEPMGISQRLVRTSVYRLVQESWLQTEKVGRYSYYSLTGPGLRRFEQPFPACLQPLDPGVEWQLVPGLPEPAGTRPEAESAGRVKVAQFRQHGAGRDQGKCIRVRGHCAYQSPCKPTIMPVNHALPGNALPPDSE